MDSSHFKSRVYQRILNINRCIVIDRPDIEIPWFMGDYVDDLKLDSQDVNSDSKFVLYFFSIAKTCPCNIQRFFELKN